MLLTVRFHTSLIFLSLSEFHSGVVQSHRLKFQRLIGWFRHVVDSFVSLTRRCVDSAPYDCIAASLAQDCDCTCTKLVSMCIQPSVHTINGSAVARQKVACL